MKRIVSLILFTSIIHSILAQTKMPENEISKNGMTVSWKFDQGHIFLTIVAPTTGWVAIGFNTTQSLTGTYLVMARVSQGEVEVVEHYTSAPGNYSSIKELGGKILVCNASGTQYIGQTKVSFSLPEGIRTTYQKKMSQGLEYHLLLAYSGEDDFQHHSAMRTSTKIKL